MLLEIVELSRRQHPIIIRRYNSKQTSMNSIIPFAVNRFFSKVGIFVGAGLSGLWFFALLYQSAKTYRYLLILELRTNEQFGRSKYSKAGMVPGSRNQNPLGRKIV